MTFLITDPLFLQHDTGHHPENSRRLVSIFNMLEKTGLKNRCQAGSYQPITEDQVLGVHDRQVLAQVKETAQTGGGFLDADTVTSSQSFQVALAAAGACRAGVDAVLSPSPNPSPLQGRGENQSPLPSPLTQEKGKIRNALCLVRPPGHHATPDRSMGFCLFNNVALAAHHARTVHGLNRILILDWDVHHGNGTQDIFFADPHILFFSIHRFGHGFYPGTGNQDETGTGKGLGYTINAPARYGTTRSEFRAMFASHLEKAADRIKPELVLVSAGFDAHVRDPIGTLGGTGLEAEDYAHLTRLILDVANTHAQGRLVSCLEGGYHLDALADCVQAHLEELLSAQ